MARVTDPRRRIPGVDRLLASSPFAPILEAEPRGRVVALLREVLAERRAALARGEEPGEAEGPEAYAAEVARRLRREALRSLRPVINATGVVLHTNLGRAPLAPAALEAMERVARGYANLEYDLEEGGRGSRYAHCVGLLRELTGGEDALVVNNNAGALVLAVNTLARGRGVVVSRGELVEIGGGFRIPEILERSGARLVEVGTTNRTHLEDYEGAAGEGVVAILKVHRSNFRITGFTREVGLRPLARLARERDLVLIHDLGSGLLVDPAGLGLPPEPTPRDSLSRGADLVTMSGDKLLGGPQAGIVVGRGELLRRMRRNPLCRALRVDKVTLAALEATLGILRDPGRALREIPALRMIATPPGLLRERALRLRRRLRGRGVPAEVHPGSSRVGGGAFPGHPLPTWLVTVEPRGEAPQRLARRLRTGSPPVVARVAEEALVLDLRCVAPEAEDDLAEAVVRAWGAGTGG